MTTERTAGPGPRKEIGGPENSQVHPPHVTENDHGAQVQGSSESPTPVPALPANAHGQDVVPPTAGADYIDDESMYEKRPAEDKNHHPADDMP
jgi:hypothetical protein